MKTCSQCLEEKELAEFYFAKSPSRKSCGKCVRALLCKRHNVVIGLLGEDLSELNRISVYLVTQEGLAR